MNHRKSQKEGMGIGLGVSWATFGLGNRISANISKLANGTYTCTHLKTRIKLSVILWMEHHATIQKESHIGQNYHAMLSYSLRVSLKV